MRKRIIDDQVLCILTADKWQINANDDYDWKQWRMNRSNGKEETRARTEAHTLLVKSRKVSSRGTRTLGEAGEAGEEACRMQVIVGFECLRRKGKEKEKKREREN